MSKKYLAYTLIEMLIVISILIILGGLTFTSFDGLQNTVKMNEYVLNLEQDIRSMQRASMLLERNPGEKWLYGIGIDFRDIGQDGNYKTFKWCAPFDDYGHISTRSKIPAYDPNLEGGEIISANLPVITEIIGSMCGNEVDSKEHLRNLPGYERSVSMPRATVSFEEENEARYVLFESVSGRAFFYNDAGVILNYHVDEETGLQINDSEDINNLVFTITPRGRSAARQLTIVHLSGSVETQLVK
jgi:type II secretory pathway pseudopilin PulG